MEGVADEVLIGAVSFFLLVAASVYLALGFRRPAARPPGPQAGAQNAQPGPPPVAQAAQASPAAQPAPRPSVRLPEADDEQEHPDSITVNLRVGEGRPVRRSVRQSATVGAFKHRIFHNEIASGVAVRFLHNGCLLQDHTTIAEAGVRNNDFIVCSLLVGADQDQAQRREVPLDRYGGWLQLWIVCLIMLGGLWILLFSTPSLFTTQSLVMLDFLTLGFVAWVVLTVRANDHVLSLLEREQQMAPAAGP